MSRQNAAAQHVKMLVISDTHLGMTNYASDMLCEFLHNTSCDTLVLNGDIVDGLRLKDRRARKFPEMQARVIDALNKKIADGTKIVYIPGNHDALFRHRDIVGKNFMGIDFERQLEFTDPKGKRLLITHGDLIGNGGGTTARVQLVPRSSNKLLQRGLDYFYVAATAVSAIVDKICGKFFHVRPNIAACTRTAIETALGKKDAYMDAATNYARKQGYDGIICGHFHMPDLRTAKDGTFYANSGDWVENFTALSLDNDGSWSRLKWSDRRRELGLKDVFNARAAKNHNLSFRPETEKMIAAIHKMWPGR